MKKRKNWIWIALISSALVVAAIGAVMKYVILRPQGLYQDKSIVEITMLYIQDEAVRRAVHGDRETTVPELPEGTTVPDTTASEPPADTTVPPDTTLPPETTVATEPPLTAMDDAWFDDVLFIGDSRTVGLRDIARSGNADYFCSVGMTVFKARDVKVSDVGFEEQKLGELLASRTYGKIFIGLGINECGYALDELMTAYRDLIAAIREAQPEAKIILQSIMTVGRKKAAEAKHFEISNLQRINDEIMALADGVKVFYIDVNEEFADEEGYLPSEMSSDGCHLLGKYDVLWEQWIRQAATDLGI